MTHANEGAKSPEMNTAQKQFSLNRAASKKQFPIKKSKQGNVMKIYRALLMLAIFILELAPVTGYSQAYVYSGPVNGWFEANLTPDGFGRHGGFGVTISSITETLYYDPASLTLEIVGSVSVSPANGTFNMSSQFTSTSDFGSATLAIGNNGNFPFDMMAYRPGLGSSIFGGQLLIPVSGSGIYNGQPFAGNWNLSIDIGQISISDVSPSFLTFSASNYVGGHNGQYVIPGTNLSTGISDGTYHYNWSQDLVVATAVPEPNAIALLGLGLALLAFLRRRLSMSCP